MITATASPDPRRWQSSFNYRIPDDMTTPGTLTVSFVVTRADGTGTPHQGQHRISFGPRIDLTVYGLVWAATADPSEPIDYTSPAAPWSDFEPHRRFTENVFPVSSLTIAPLPGVGRAAPSPQPFHTLTQARAWAAAELGELPPRSVINILNNWTTDKLKNIPASNHGQTSGRVSEEENGQEPFRVGEVMAHELAHAYGLPWHTFVQLQNGKPTLAHTPYPDTANGYIADDDYGVDLTHGEPALVSQRHDIMSYGMLGLDGHLEQDWISSFTYEMLLHSITAAQGWHPLGGSVTGPSAGAPGDQAGQTSSPNSRTGRSVTSSSPPLAGGERLGEPWRKH